MHTHDLEPLLRGHADLERTDRGWLPHRLPHAARAQFDDPQVATAEAQPSGVRLCLRTTATEIELDVLRTRVVLSGLPPRPDGAVDLVVDGHPDVPMLVIGPLYCPIHETTSGPGAFDPEGFAAGELRFIATGVTVDPDAPRSPLDRLTLVGIRERLADLVEARAEHDPHLSYLDGLNLYGSDDSAEHPLPDGLHPDATTHRLIGERFARVARAPGGLFVE